MQASRVLPVDFPVREALEQLLERDATFEPGESRAQAVVPAVHEREVVTDRAMDVETVAVGETTVVTVRRADEEQHGAPFGYEPAVQLDVLVQVPGDVGAGGS